MAILDLTVLSGRPPAHRVHLPMTFLAERSGSSDRRGPRAAARSGLRNLT